MKYYPVIVPTLNRYEHLKRLVKSLVCNTHAEKTELVIGLDYPPSDKYKEGYEKIKAYLPTIVGFKKVTIITTEKNLGPLKNLMRLLEYVRQQGYDACIESEDDNEFSPCFLDYMNKALEKYKNEDKVLYICGYTPFQHNIKENTYFTKHNMSAWGCATWFTKADKTQSLKTIESLNSILNNVVLSMKLYSKRPNSLNGMIDQVANNTIYGDSCNISYCLINDTYCLFPTKSLVRNWGNDGTGVHCKVNSERFIKMPINDAKEFHLMDIPISESSEIRSLLIKDYSKKWYGNCAILIRYAIWRLFHKDIRTIFKNRKYHKILYSNL